MATSKIQNPRVYYKDVTINLSEVTFTYNIANFDLTIPQGHNAIAAIIIRVSNTNSSLMVFPMVNSNTFFSIKVNDKNYATGGTVDVRILYE